MPTLPNHRPWLALLLSLAGTACSLGPTQFNVKRAPDFPEGPTTIAILGIFEAGRMSPEAWEQLGPSISASLGQRMCEVAYEAKLEREDPQTFAEVDDYTQNNGVTDELLQKLAPRASGELIMSISVHGRAGVTTHAGSVDPRLAQSPQQPIPTSRRSKVRATPSVSPTQMSGPKPVVEDSDLEISATLFSVRHRRSVARVSMIYTGPSADDVIQKFAARLRAELPGATCRGWSWGAPAD